MSGKHCDVCPPIRERGTFVAKPMTADSAELESTMPSQQKVNSNRMLNGFSSAERTCGSGSWLSLASALVKTTTEVALALVMLRCTARIIVVSVALGNTRFLIQFLLSQPAFCRQCTHSFSVSPRAGQERPGNAERSDACSVSN